MCYTLRCFKIEQMFTMLTKRKGSMKNYLQLIKTFKFYVGFWKNGVGKNDFKRVINCSTPHKGYVTPKENIILTPSPSAFDIFLGAIFAS